MKQVVQKLRYKRIFKTWRTFWRYLPIFTFRWFLWGNGSVLPVLRNAANASAQLPKMFIFSSDHPSAIKSQQRFYRCSSKISKYITKNITPRFYTFSFIMDYQEKMHVILAKKLFYVSLRIVRIFVARPQWVGGLTLLRKVCGATTCEPKKRKSAKLLL